MGEINKLCRSGMGSSSANTSPVLSKSNNTSAVATQSATANSSE